MNRWISSQRQTLVKVIRTVELRLGDGGGTNTFHTHHTNNLIPVLTSSYSLPNLVVSKCKSSETRSTVILQKESQAQALKFLHPALYQAKRHFYFQSAARAESSEPDSTTTTMPHCIVGHDKQKHYFYIQLREGNSSSPQTDLAILEYRWIRPDLVDLYHTGVPPEFQGQGIAKHLAKAAFDHFCEKEIKFHLTCTYLQKYLKDNPLPRYTYFVDKESAI